MQATVSDDRHAVLASSAGRLEDGSHLGDADTGNHTSGADRARPDADLDAVGSGLAERLGGLVGGDVAADDVYPLGSRLGLELGYHVENALGVAVSGVDDDEIDPLLHQCHGAFPRVAEETDGSTHA